MTAFGARAFVIDGHDIAAIDQTLAEAGRQAGTSRRSSWPGRSRAAASPRWRTRKTGTASHSRRRWPNAPSSSSAANVTCSSGARCRPGTPRHPARSDGAADIKLPAYDLGQKVATRKAYGDALAAIGVRPDVVAMDGEVSNSTFADEFAKAYPERYFEMFIAEQQLVAAAVGFGVRGYRPFASTFAAFFTRAYDFIRMAAISQANICLVGSHAGVEIGADGPSQMALEDLAMIRAVHGSTVLYPCDATSAAALTATMADLDGISYMRTTRGAYPVLYAAGESFPVGGSKVLRESGDDQVTLIGAGITLHECLAAAVELAGQGVSARVIDLYSVKPADAATLAAAAAATRAGW